MISPSRWMVGILWGCLYLAGVEHAESRSDTVRSERDTSTVIDIAALGAIGDGVNDDGAVIQAAVDMLPETGGVVILPRPAVAYRVAGTITLHRKRGVSIRGDSALCVLTGFIGIGIHIRESSNCLLSGLMIRGQDTLVPGANAAAIKVSRSRRIRVENITIDGAVTNGIEGFLSSDCVVQDNIVRRTRNHNGIGWAGGSGNIFARNTCLYNRGQGIEIRSQQWAIVRENLCSDNGSAVEQSSGITIEAEDGDRSLPGVDRELQHGSFEILVERNRCVRNVHAGIYIVASRHDTVRNVRVTENVLTDNRGSGVFLATGVKHQDLRTVHDITIASNRFENQSGAQRYDLWLYFVRSVTIRANIHSGSFTGVRSDASSAVDSDVRIVPVQ